MTVRFNPRLGCQAWIVGLSAMAGGCVTRVTEPQSISGHVRMHSSRIEAAHPTDRGVFIITTDDTVLDLHGADLVGAGDGTPPDRFVGRGIVVRGAKNVTIRNAVIRGFKVGIYAEDAPGLCIENCDLSRNYRQRLKSTARHEHLDDWLYGHENDGNEWLRYGAGVYLLRCPGAVVKDCRARNGQNGICLIRSDDAAIERNDVAFMSGWGLAMWRSSRCRILGNRFDYCVRGYSHGVYARGQDSAGILVYEQCCDNVFAFNSATHGGDGFFLYAGNETVKRTGRGGCNRNLVYRNDFSHAVANGIEATFSSGNSFIANRLHECRYAVWAGYSRESFIMSNDMASCDTGIAIEHGIKNTMCWNQIRDCKTGVHCWWDDDKDLLSTPYCQNESCDSFSETLEGNQISHCAVGVWCDNSESLSFRGNSVLKCDQAIRLGGGSSVRQFRGQAIGGGTIQHLGQSPFIADQCYLEPDVNLVGPIDIRQPASSPTEAQDAAKTTTIPLGPGVGLREVVEFNRLPIQREAIKNLDQGPGTWPDPIPAIQPGKQFIVIDEWGPYDFSNTNIIRRPQRVFAPPRRR